MIEKELTLKQLALHISGVLEGDEKKIVKRPSEPDTAGPDDAVFFKGLVSKDIIEKCDAGVFIVIENQTSVKGKNFIKIKNPDEAFISFLSLYDSAQDEISLEQGVSSFASISSSALVAPTAFIGKESSVGERTIIGASVRIGKNVKIGKDCKIHPYVTIYNETQIGDRVTIKENTVIGGRGFGYVKIKDKHVPVPQIGNVVIGDDVDIGSSVCIDRGTIGATVIGNNVKIDNLVQIAHNVKIGDNTIIVSQTGISGSVRIGKNVILAGQAGIADHIIIEDNAIIGAKAGVLGRVKAGEFVLGVPARPAMKFKKSIIFIERLENLFKRLEILEKKQEDSNE